MASEQLENNIQGRNPLGYEPIAKLLLAFSVPSVISMLVNSVYNIVDQIFIGQGVGVLGNAATTIAFPVVPILRARATRRPPAGPSTTCLSSPSWRASS